VAESPHVSVANELRARIAGGQMRLGDQVPAEPALAAEFATTRLVIREALGILRAEGLIGGRTGAPLTVQRAVLSQDFDLLVPFTAWVRSLGREPGARTLEVGMRGADQLVAEELGLPPRSPVLHYKRLRTLDGQPVMIEHSSYPEAIGRLLRDCDLDRESVTDRLAAHGIEFARALHRVEAVPARARDAELLEVARRTALLQVRRRSYDHDGRRIEFGVDRYRGESFGLVVHSGEP
jgi:GntR family transcriptional regulator